MTGIGNYRARPQVQREVFRAQPLALHCSLILPLHLRPRLISQTARESKSRYMTL
jgi:hypothetical protein